VDPPSPPSSDNDDDGDFGGLSSPPPRAPSPPSPPRAKSTLSAPAPAKGKKQTSSLPPAITPKKRRIVVKKIGPKKKLAYEMTDEELAEQTHHELIEHFKPKVLEKRVPVDPIETENFYNCLSDIAKRLVKLHSDYDRTLIKAHQRMRQSGKGVPQLGT
jgi:hypothetical protein